MILFFKTYVNNVTGQRIRIARYTDTHVVTTMANEYTHTEFLASHTLIDYVPPFFKW